MTPTGAFWVSFVLIFGLPLLGAVLVAWLLSWERK